jgi:hypothetical protein
VARDAGAGEGNTMNTSKTSALAIWLVERSGADPALIGDILEEYARGDRSRRWLWRHVVNLVFTPVRVSRARALRWVAALPLAMLAIGTEGLLMDFIGRSVELPSVYPDPTHFHTQLELTLRYYVLQGVVAASFFVPAWTFVTVGVWVSPTRKNVVALVALAVVVVVGVLMMGAPDRPAIWLGGCIVVGGLAAYWPWRERRKADSATSDVPW